MWMIFGISLAYVHCQTCQWNETRLVIAGRVSVINMDFIIWLTSEADEQLSDSKSARKKPWILLLAFIVIVNITESEIIYWTMV